METKILILLKSIDGGTGTYLEGLLELKKVSKNNFLNYRVLVLDKPKFRRPKSNEFLYFSDNIANPEKYNLSLNNIVLFLKQLNWFRKNVKRYSPDIVISSNPYSIMISEIDKCFYKFKYKTVDLIQNNLNKVIDFKSPVYLKSATELILKFLLNKSDKVVAVSKDLSEELSKGFGLHKIPDVLYGVLPRYFLTKKKTIKHSAKKVIISIARLDPQKDHETLLKAFQIANQKNDNLELWIVGDGPKKGYLISLSKKLGIDKNVKFLGWNQNPEILLDKSDIFVLSSNWEGFPMVLLEAMSKGLPVISSDCEYGPREILDKNKYGILVPVGNSIALSNAMVLLLSDDGKADYYSRMALIRSKYYSGEKMLVKFRNIISKLLP